MNSGFFCAVKFHGRDYMDIPVIVSTPFNCFVHLFPPFLLVAFPYWSFQNVFVMFFVNRKLIATFRASKFGDLR